MVIISASAEAQNLVTNGSFETETLSGWTSTGNVAVESGVPVSQGTYALVLTSTSGPNGNVSQSFTAIPGNAYLLSYDYAATGSGGNESIAVSIFDSNGLALVATQVNPQFTNDSYRKFSALFVATTATETLSFRDESGAGATRDGLLDNVQIVQSPPFSHPGIYEGVAVETGSYYTSSVVESRSFPIKMQITSAGQFFELEATAPVSYAIGTVSDSGVATLGNAALSSGVVEVHGNSLVIDFTSNTGLGGNFAPYTYVETRKYVVHKIR